MDLKSQIQSTFKLSGLTVRIEASKYLAGLLAPVPDDDRYANVVMSFTNIRPGIINWKLSHLYQTLRQAWVDKILDQVQSQNLKSSIIEKETLVSAVKECTSKEKGTVSTVDPLTVIDAFETPRLTFSVERKKYLSDEVEFTECLLV